MVEILATEKLFHKWGQQGDHSDVYMHEQKQKYMWKGGLFAVECITSLVGLGVWKCLFLKKIWRESFDKSGKGSNLMWNSAKLLFRGAVFSCRKARTCWGGYFETYDQACAHHFIWVPPPPQKKWTGKKKKIKNSIFVSTILKFKLY